MWFKPYRYMNYAELKSLRDKIQTLMNDKYEHEKDRLITVIEQSGIGIDDLKRHQSKVVKIKSAAQ